MKWIKRKIKNWLNEPEEDVVKSIGISSPKELQRPEQDPILQFRVYSAENGQVLEFSRYDRVKDRCHNSVYIINKDEEVADKVAKCLSLEMLK